MAKAVNAVETDAQMRLRWQAEEDASTLRRASEISADPSRLKHVKKHLDSQQLALQKTVSHVDSLQVKPKTATKTAPIVKSVQPTKTPIKGKR